MKLKIIGTLAAVAATAATAAIAVPALAAPAAGTIQISETSYRITLARTPTAGRTTFVIRNVDEDAHDFWLRGGGRTFKSKVIPGSGTARLTATLKKGVRYQFWCAVGSHAEKGMRGSFVAR